MTSSSCNFGTCVDRTFCAGLCKRHFNQQQRHGSPGCRSCGVNDVPPYKRQCTACLSAEFRRYGQELLDPAAFRRATLSAPCRCLTCGTIADKWLGSLRRLGAHCEGCYAPTRAAIGDRTRLTPTQAGEILERAGWTLTDTYRTALTPVLVRCHGCGSEERRRVGDIHAKIKRGVRLYGCLACVRREYPPSSRVSLEQAVKEFEQAGICYIADWSGGQRAVQGRCRQCEHRFRPSLKHVRAGHGCPRCNVSGFWSVARVERHPELAARPAVLYLVEFTDWDSRGTVFHKVGIGTLGAKVRSLSGACDRLYRHLLDGARVLDSHEADLLTCLRAEQSILKDVGSYAYTPSRGRIRGGYTECFLPGKAVDLGPQIDQATTL